MKSIKKYAAALVVMAAAIVMMGCKPEVHVHTFSTDWTTDSESHWHESTCGHDVRDSEDHHEWNHEDYKYDSNSGKDARTCTVCNYVDEKDHEHSWKEGIIGANLCSVCGYMEANPEGFVSVAGTEIKGTETWTPSSSVFVSGRKLTIPTLLVCDHEVTRGEFKAVMGTDPSTAAAYDKDGNKLTGDTVLNNPVGCVNWYDAIAYCNKLSIKEKLTPCYTVEGITDWEKLEYSSIPTSGNKTWNAAECDFTANGYRLPTEAEWEWLARGGESYTYAGSNTVGEVAWYTKNTNDTGSREVKTKKKNGYDLYDMSGNVWEWCWDWYGDSIDSSSAATGAASGSGRVLRGGSWYNYDYYCLVARRSDDYPLYRYYYYGLRVVRSSSK